MQLVWPVKVVLHYRPVVCHGHCSLSHEVCTVSSTIRRKYHDIHNVKSTGTSRIHRFVFVVSRARKNKSDNGISLLARLRSGRMHTCKCFFPLLCLSQCQLPAPLVHPSSPPLGNSCVPECSNYRGLKKQIRSIKLEQGATLGPVIVIGRDSRPDSSDEASISSDRKMRDEGILGPVIVIGRDFQDTCTEASDCEGPRVKSSTNGDTLAPVIIIGQHPSQGISTEASNGETLHAKSGNLASVRLDCRNRLAENFSTNGRVQTDVQFFPTSDITSDALGNEGVNVVTTTLGPRNEKREL